MKQTLCSEGLVLHKFAFRDHDEIITVLTKNFGMIKLMVKNARRTRKGQEGVTTPLTLAEFTFFTNSGEIWNSQEIHPLPSNHHHLRNRLDILQAAGTIVQTVLKTQGLHHPVPELFTLVKTFLKKLPEVPYPPALSASFVLKLLKYDGVLGDERLNGWDEQETALARFLANSRSLNELASTPVPPHFVDRVKSLLIS